DYQNIENREHRDNCQQGAARKTLTGEVRPLLTANELWHFGATTVRELHFVREIQSRMLASATRSQTDLEAISPPSIVAILGFREVPQDFQYLTSILRHS